MRLSRLMNVRLPKAATRFAHGARRSVSGAAHAEDELEKRGQKHEEQGDRCPIERAAGQSEPSGDSKDKGKGSTSERRRLSKIFQREMVEMGLRTYRPDSSGTRENIHWAICQSPRTQRCLRRV